LYRCYKTETFNIYTMQDIAVTQDQHVTLVLEEDQSLKLALRHP